MHTLKLTVFIDEDAGLDMEVRVVAPEHGAAPAEATTALLPLRRAATARPADDEYELGGYAGI
jgi:hypothetical protein